MEGSLGDRMRAAMAGLFVEGASMVVLVGSDLPDITPELDHGCHLAPATRPELTGPGPARDGGYYLIAATTVPNVFDGIEWGSSHVLEDTQAAAATNGLRVHLLEPLRDVDTPVDLDAVVAPRTRAWLLGSSQSS